MTGLFAALQERFVEPVLGAGAADLHRSAAAPPFVFPVDEGLHLAEVGQALCVAPVG